MTTFVLVLLVAAVVAWLLRPPTHRQADNPIEDPDELEAAEAELAALVASYRDKHPHFANWLGNNVPEGLAVFTLPDAHQKRMRTSNGIERPIQQELKRRTSKVRVFPNLKSLERLSTAVLVEIDEKWETETKPYIKWEQLDE